MYLEPRKQSFQTHKKNIIITEYIAVIAVLFWELAFGWPSWTDPLRPVPTYSTFEVCERPSLIDVWKMALHVVAKVCGS